MQIDISYLNINFGKTNCSSFKNETINFIILLAKYYIIHTTSKYKHEQQFLKV